MKNYTLPAMALFAIASLFAFAGFYTFQLVRSAQQAVVNQDIIREGVELQLKTAKANSERANRDSIPVEKFIGECRDQFKAGEDQSQIFGRLDSLAVAKLLSSTDKTPTQNAGYLFAGSPRKVLGVTIKVAGDYSRIVNWLGESEAAYPLARVESISFTVNNDTVSMHTVLSFPQFFSEDHK